MFRGLKNCIVSDILTLTMNCFSCGAEARTVEVRSIVGKKEHTLHLCHACARAYGIHTDRRREPEVTSLYASLLSSGAGPDASDDSDECGACGTSWAQLRRSRQAGCPACYATFASDISRMIGGSRDELRHTGRLPESLLRFRTLIVDRENLKDDLRRSVEDEDFESAARIRDRLGRMDQQAKDAEI